MLPAVLLPVLLAPAPQDPAVAWRTDVPAAIAEAAEAERPLVVVFR